MDKAGLDLSRLRTVHVVPLTAFDSRGQVDLERQAALTTRLARAGMRVFLPGAGTSEFHSLTAEEVLELVQVTKTAAGPDSLVFAPVGMQLGQAIQVGRRARDVGATGIMFMPFTHPYLSQTGIRDYYLEVMQQVELPTLIYKKSPFPSDALLLELADNPWVVGVKYAENNLHDFRKTVVADRGRIEWLCGSAERFAPFFMLAGAGGYTSGAGNLCPHITLAMHAAFAAGEYAQGLELQQLLLPIEDFRAREGDSYNISMLKYALTLCGLDFGPARPPQRRLTATDEQQIDALLKPILAAEEALQREMQTAGFPG